MPTQAQLVEVAQWSKLLRNFDPMHWRAYGRAELSAVLSIGEQPCSDSLRPICCNSRMFRLGTSQCGKQKTQMADSGAM